MKTALERARDHEATVRAKFLAGGATFQEVARAQSALEALEGEAADAGPPLSRDVIAKMTPAEFAEREGEIDRWMRAGGTDGAGAPVGGKRPDDHVWTRAEIQAMTPAEFEANEAAIDAAATAGQITA